jgi:hypothetical protein
MPEQSTKDEMNAAIRAQRERQNVPRSIAGDPPPQQQEGPVAPPPAAEPEPEPEKPKGLFSRLLGR